MADKYIRDIRWSEEDQAFIGRAPELAGVATHGDTPEETMRHLNEAITLHLESLKAHGEKLPDPAALRKLNGNIPLRIDKEEHQDLYLAAQAHGVSVNKYIKDIINKTITRNAWRNYAPKKVKKNFAPARAVKSPAKTKRKQA